MDFRRTCLTLALVSLAAAAGAVPSSALTPGTRAALSTRAARPARVNSIDNRRRMDVNNINMFVTNIGSYAWDLVTQNAGLMYPKGTNKTAVYAAGLWFGAQVEGETRTVVSEYSQEYGPGTILPDGSWDSPSNPAYIVYKVVAFSGDSLDTAHVDRPAADLLADPLADPLVHHSWSEYVSGAGPHGAPVKIYRMPGRINPADSVNVPGPDMLGDMMTWAVYNDADPDNHTNEAGNSAPLDLEVRQTMFAFKGGSLDPLGNTVFLKWQVIHPKVASPPPGTAFGDTLKNMFVSMWSDPDLGGGTDDLVGCDTIRSLGFCYNATNNDQLYGATPPAVGWDFFLGPKPFAGAPDTLGMVSFNKYINGTDPNTKEKTYNYMQGLNADGTALVNPVTSGVTTFFNSGDPVSGTGWLDNNAADKRLMLSSGPFTMAPGDTQTIVGALIIGQGTDRLSSVAGLKFFDDRAQFAFDKNFDVPRAPGDPKVQATLDHGQVRLCWDSASRFRYNQPGYVFEGYNVYQGESVGGPWHRVATYDEVDNVRIIRDVVFDLTTGQTIQDFPVAFGSDAGVQYCHVQTEDKVHGGPLNDATQYYFAVTAYSYTNDPTLEPKVLESAQVPVRVIPQRPASGTDPSTASATDVTYLQEDPALPPATGSVEVQVVTPPDVTGDIYKVSFQPLVPPFTGQMGIDTATVRFTWTLTDSTTGVVKLSGQVNQRGDEDYRVVDGLSVKVIGLYFPQLQTVAYRNLNTDNRRALTAASNWSGNPDNWFFGGAGPAKLLFSNCTRLDPAVKPDSFTSVKLVFTGDRNVGQKAYRYLRLELGDSSSAGSVGDAPPQGTGYVYGGYHTIPMYAIDTVHGDTLEVAWVERMRTDSTGTYMPLNKQPASQDSSWTPDDPTAAESAREYLFILRSKYRPDPDPAFTDAGVPGALRRSLMPAMYALWASYRTVDDVIDPGDEMAFTWAIPFTASDVYVFGTSTLKRGNVALAKAGLGRVRVVPNPYYNRSRYEITQFNRLIRFINMPELATVRIFNLSGQLVRTLHKTDPTTSELNWDLLTENQLPVASGVYIYHVDAPGVGSTFGRLVVFMEKERLNTF